MPDLLKDFYTTDEAANKLGLHVGSVRRMLQEDDLEGIKIGHVWLIYKKSVKEYSSRTAGMAKNDPRRRN